jgi:hypothetical protein
MSSEVRSQALPDGSTQWTAGSFVAVFRQLAPGVIYVASAGNVDLFVAAMGRSLDEEIARTGRIRIFANLLEATRISGEARDAWAAWSKTAKSQKSCLCLVRSKLVDMGVSLIGYVSGSDLKSTSDIGAFENAMRLAAPGVRVPDVKKPAG